VDIKETDCEMWTGSIFLRIWTNGGLLWT